MVKRFSKKLISLLAVLSLLACAMLSFSITANAETAGCVVITDVEVASGKYFKDGAVTDEKPSDNYAYYNNGILELHNFTLKFQNYTGIYCESALTIELYGENSIDGTDGDETISIWAAEVIFKGNGSLDVKNIDNAIYSEGNITIKGGNITATSENYAAFYSEKNFIMDGGKINAKTCGNFSSIYPYAGTITINKGTVNLEHTGTYAAIFAHGYTQNGGKVTAKSTGNTLVGYFLGHVVINDGELDIINTGSGAGVEHGTGIRIDSIIDGENSDYIQKGGDVFIDVAKGCALMLKAGVANLEGGKLTIDAADCEDDKVAISSKQGMNIKDIDLTIKNAGDTPLYVKGGTLTIDGKCKLDIETSNYGITAENLNIISAKSIKIVSVSDDKKAVNATNVTIGDKLYAFASVNADGSDMTVFDVAQKDNYKYLKINNEGCTVTFDANGGSGSMDNVSKLCGEYTLPACGFTAPSGKQFKAWSVDGKEKAVGDKITVAEDKKIKAVWENVATNDPTPTAEPDVTPTVTPENVVTEAPTEEITVTEAPTTEPVVTETATPEVTPTETPEASSEPTEQSADMTWLWIVIAVVVVAAVVVVVIIKSKEKKQ